MLTLARLRAGLGRLPVMRPAVALLRKGRDKRRRLRVEARPLPLIVAVELTNVCNLRCAKCPLSHTKRPKGFIEESLFEKILRDIESAGAPTEIALSGAGEPTLHPKVVDFVKAARGIRNIGVIGFATNGVALTPDLSERLLDAGLTRLKASLDTDDAAKYLRLNGADAYEQVAANFRRFCEINKSTGSRCDVTLKVTLYDRDLTLARRLTEQWSPHVNRVRVTPLHNWAGTRGARNPTVEGHLCPMPWQLVQVLWDGQITLCCMDNMEGRVNMGDARKVNLSSYWQRDPGLKRVRRQHMKGDLSALPVCASCDMSGYSDINLQD